MANKTVMKRLEQIDQIIYDAVEKIRSIDIDTCDDLDLEDIIDDLDSARDIIFKLKQALPTL